MEVLCWGECKEKCKKKIAKNKAAGEQEQCYEGHYDLTKLR